MLFRWTFGHRIFGHAGFLASCPHDLDVCLRRPWLLACRTVMPRPPIPAWDLVEAQRLLENPAVRVLRSSNAAFTLTFLHRAFKEHHAVAVPESHLRARLENFLDEVRSEHPGAMSQASVDYLAAWCGPEHLLLRKLFNQEADEPVFELTAAAERAMQWLEDLHERAFVSTESRLELIMRQLEEIVLFSTPDAAQRVAALRVQQAALQRQIDAVEAMQTAETYGPVKLSERFANTLDLARALTADFRQLEENFKDVARQLAEERTLADTTKGQIVGKLLDTHAALKESSQGQSFYAFWSLLSSPERQQRFRDLTRQVYQIEEIDAALRANRLLERLSSRLLVEGERVVRSNERMAATLRRALEHAASGEDRRLRELIREIQRLAISRQAAPPVEDEFFDLPAPPAVFASFSRSFWRPEAIGQVVGELEAEAGVLDLEMVERFRELAEINLARLREQLRVCLIATDPVLLSHVLDRFPPREGILEVIGYLVIATESEEHYVAPDQLARVRTSTDPERPEWWQVPEVLFARQRSA